MRLTIFLLVILFTMTIIPLRDMACAKVATTESGALFFPIKASNKWNSFGDIHLKRGEIYRLSVKGCWMDSSINVDAVGYSSDSCHISASKQRLFLWMERWRRAPDSNWFSLVCTIGKDYSTVIDVGGLLKKSMHDHVNYRAQKSGPLYCFANDLPFMYWNNKGAIQLSIEPIMEKK